MQGVDSILPVDVYIPGCPPRPEALLDGLMRLQQKIMQDPEPALRFAKKKGKSQPADPVDIAGGRD